MIEQIKAIKISDERLQADWDRIVHAGKASPKLRKNAKARGKSKNDPKYYDPKYLEHTGAINGAEFKLLHQAVKFFRPKNIIEVGTWFGTSANAMASALEPGGKVYTCDKYDLFVAPRDNIVYHNSLSTKLLDLLIKEGTKIGMAFWDAKFMRGDCEKLLQLVNPLIFMCHDYEEGEKGWRCVQELLEKSSEELQVESDGIIALVTKKVKT